MLWAKREIRAVTSPVGVTSSTSGDVTVVTSRQWFASRYLVKRCVYNRSTGYCPGRWLVHTFPYQCEKKFDL